METVMAISLLEWSDWKWIFQPSRITDEDEDLVNLP
jgi:hypothetical protein